MSLDELSMHRLGLGFIYRMVPVIIVSILYGVYMAILITATHALAQRGLKIRANAIILFFLWFLFLMSTSLWGLELAQLVGLNQILLKPSGLDPNSLFNRFYDLIARETKITGVLFECQMILGDILVIWRASAIWHDRRIMTIIPLFWWALMIVNMLVHASFCQSGVSTTDYGKLCKVTDILAPTLSIVVNVSVMALTLCKAWLLRDVLIHLHKKTKNSKIISLFVLLIESGTLYVIILVTDLLVTSFVVGDNETVQRMISCISGYATVQFVGIYPTLMIVMLRKSVWNSSEESFVSYNVSPRARQRSDALSVTVSTVVFHRATDVEKSMQFSSNPAALSDMLSVPSHDRDSEDRDTDAY
ncbi:hypothetical protein BDW22DRAFT_1219304 [Trametopsis cervina]|nr:hypothetical protein BDW22DRAFT_1219304 [Trametopsis cervina]